MQTDRKPWTSSEVRRLRRLAETATPTRVIGLKLGRTPAGVRSKASELGISLKSSKQPPIATFTLRFRNEKTHEALKATAKALGVPMGELAETAIEQELALMGSGFESRLTRTVELLRSARRAVLDEDIESFAKAEVTEDDPLQSRHLGHQDPLGVSSAFARSME